ncbi:hypothetical protein [Corynebacterium sp.]|uniref:hypothetical protein n=1 Tax=Corynebacterium sp. TaxID=1720 RepID=UPI0025BE73CC|nr:hypothetical protein [Corynebacterium sp.]
MAIEKITSVIASTDDWTMSTAGVAPTMKRGDDGKFYQQNNDAGEGRWTITLMVQRPGSTTLEQLDVKVWGCKSRASPQVRWFGLSATGQLSTPGACSPAIGSGPDCGSRSTVWRPLNGAPQIRIIDPGSPHDGLAGHAYCRA